jgi:hypothetical protein
MPPLPPAPPCEEEEAPPEPPAEAVDAVDVLPPPVELVVVPDAAAFELVVVVSTSALQPIATTKQATKKTSR